MVQTSSVILVTTLVASTHAFVAPHRPVGTSSFVQQRQAPQYSSSALQMNLFDRFARVAKSNLNNILKNLEDPEKIMNQAVEDMQVRDCFLDRPRALMVVHYAHQLFCLE